MLEKLTEQLKESEGFKSKPYRDTKGILTVGYGYNLQSNILKLSKAEISTINKKGVTKEQASSYLSRCIELSNKDVNKNFPAIMTAPEKVQLVIYDMGFNLGWSKLSKFVKLLAAVKAKDYKTAAKEMKDSNWYTEVGDRSERLVKLMLS